MLTLIGGTRMEVQAFGPSLRCQGVAFTKCLRPSHRSVQVSAGKEKDKLQEQVKEVNEVCSSKQVPGSHLCMFVLLFSLCLQPNIFPRYDPVQVLKQAGAELQRQSAGMHKDR